MSTTLTLTEWKRHGDLGLTAAQVRRLQRTFRAEVAIEQAPTGGETRWSVTPSSIVGTAVAAGMQIVVRPKTPVSNVLFLLGTAAGREPEGAMHDALEMAHADDLTEAVAGLFARVTERTLLQGVLRGYRPVAEVRHTVRGRVDVAEQLRRRPGRAMPVAVRYEEHDEDVLENRLLLAAARTLLRLRSDTRAQRRLRRVVAALDDVTPITFRHPVPAVTWTRLNARYRPAVELARVVLAGAGVDVDAGSRDAVGLTVDMNAAFEAFVCRSLGDALATHGGRAESQDQAWTLDDEGSVRLRPDLVWYRSSGRTGAVIDAKYKVRAGVSTPESDVYQMLAYCTALGLPDGHLVYAEAGKGPRVTVRHGGPTIHMHTLDVSRPPPELLAEARRVAAVIRAIDSGARSDTPARR